MFFFKGGPYDLPAPPVTVDGQRIRLRTANFQKADNAQRAFTTRPAYRVSQGAMRTMQWRLLDCFRQQRMPEMEFFSQASIDLITYMGVKAKDGTMDAPAIKRLTRTRNIMKNQFVIGAGLAIVTVAAALVGCATARHLPCAKG